MDENTGKNISFWNPSNIGQINKRLNLQNRSRGDQSLLTFTVVNSQLYMRKLEPKMPKHFLTSGWVSFGIFFFLSLACNVHRFIWEQTGTHLSYNGSRNWGREILIVELGKEEQLWQKTVKSNTFFFWKVGDWDGSPLWWIKSLRMDLLVKLRPPPPVGLWWILSWNIFLRVCVWVGMKP